MRSSLAVLLSLAIASPALAAMPLPAHAPTIPPRKAWRAPAPAVTSTPSGMRVAVLADHALPLVHLMVTVQAGAALDGKHPGLAATTARFLQEGGAGRYSAEALAAAVDDLGGELKIDPDVAGVRISLTVLSSDLDRALALVSDVVARPRFDAAEWPAVQKRQLAEVLRRLDEPRHVADDVFDRALYGDHPYAQPVDGTRASVGALTLDDVRAFYAHHYGPRATTVILVGDATPGEATRAVERAFAEGAHWNAKVAPPPAPKAAHAGAGRVVIVDRPGAPQSEVRVGELGIAWSSPDLAPATLLEMVLGGSFTSRLMQDLREKHGYTYGARCEFRFLRAPGPFVAQAAVRTNVTAESVREFLLQIAGIRAPMTEAELHKGRALVLQDLVEQFGNGRQAAELLGDLALFDRPLDFWRKLPSMLGGVALPALTRAAERLFQPNDLLIVIVGDRKVIEPRMRALGLWKSVELRDADGNLVK